MVFRYLIEPESLWIRAEVESVCHEIHGSQTYGCCILGMVCDSKLCGLLGLTSPKNLSLSDQRPILVILGLRNKKKSKPFSLLFEIHPVVHLKPVGTNTKPQLSGKDLPQWALQWKSHHRPTWPPPSGDWIDAEKNPTVNSDEALRFWKTSDMILCTTEVIWSPFQVGRNCLIPFLFGLSLPGVAQQKFNTTANWHQLELIQQTVFQSAYSWSGWWFQVIPNMVTW